MSKVETIVSHEKVLVRCKDCKFWRFTDEKNGICSMHRFSSNCPNGFCHLGVEIDIVRCYECVHWDEGGYDYGAKGYCDYWENFFVDYGDYCSHGERGRKNEK